MTSFLVVTDAKGIPAQVVPGITSGHHALEVAVRLSLVAPDCLDVDHPDFMRSSLPEGAEVYWVDSPEGTCVLEMGCWIICDSPAGRGCPTA
jgi:hypothetical protein